MAKKLRLYLLIAVGINEIMRNRYTLSISLLTISGVTSFTLIPITHDFLGLFVILAIISLIFSASTVRLSNVCVYNKITKHLSMVVDDLDLYHEMNYVRDKDKVAELFQEQFVQGIEEAYRRKYRKISMTTHRWVAINVARYPTVQSLYNSNVKASGKCKIPMEVLLLASQETIESFPQEMSKYAFHIRNQFKVSLTRK